MEKHDTVGRDLVNHCVNDILVQGAAPLFFLDYIGTGKVAPAVIEEIVSGLAAACQEAGCVLLGGETAEMPGFYQEGEYDLVGTIVGVVEEEKLLPKVEMAAGISFTAWPLPACTRTGIPLPGASFLRF